MLKYSHSFIVFFGFLALAVFLMPLDAKANSQTFDYGDMVFPVDGDIVAVKSFSLSMDLFPDVGNMVYVKRIPSISLVAIQKAITPISNGLALTPWKSGQASQAFSKRHRRMS